MLIRLILILFLTVGCSSNIQAKNDYQEIKEIIYDFIKFQRDVILYGETEIGNSKDNIKCSEDEFIHATNDALNKRDINNLSERVLIGYSLDLHDFQILEENDILIVTFFEDYEENYEWTNSYIYTKNGSIEEVSPGREDKSAGSNLENVIKLKKDQNNGWMIVDHIVYSMVVKKPKQGSLEKLKQFGEIFKSKKNKVLNLFYPDKNSTSSSRIVGGKYRIKEIESD